MSRIVGMFVLAAVLVATSDGQETAKTKAAKLPSGWSKLGLSAEVKKKAMTIITEAQAKVAELQQQIATIRQKERTDLNALLTDDQRAELRKLLEAKAGVTPPTDKKDPGK